MKTIGITVVGFILMSVATGNTEVITLSGIIRCPYICGDNQDRPGFLLEIAQIVFKQAGYQVVFKSLPWKRAVTYARAQRIQGIVGVLRKNVPDFIFPEEAQAFQQQRFFVKNGNSWKYNGFLSLKKVKLGLYDGYSYSYLDSYIRKYRNTPLIQFVSGEKALQQNIWKLKVGRVTAIIEDYAVMHYNLVQKGKTKLVTEAGQLGGENLYIAFSPTHPASKRYAEILTQAMRTLRANGKLDRILASYGIQDWKADR